MIPKEAIEATAGKILEAIISCSHEICADHVKLEYSHKQAGHNAYNQLHRRVTSALTAAFAAMSEPVVHVRPCRVSPISGDEYDSFTLSSPDHPKAFPLYAVPQPAAVKVKPLEWIEREDQRGTYDAMTPMGNAIASTDEQWRGFWFIVGLTNTNYVDGDVETAKAAAQADYETRILSALEGGGE